MKHIKSFRIYFFISFFILFSGFGILLLKYFNPRNVETIQIATSSFLSNKDILNQLKIFRLTVNNEILEIGKDEKLNDSTIVFLSERVFIKKILIRLPDSIISSTFNFQIKIGSKRFHLSNQNVSKNWVVFGAKTIAQEEQKKEVCTLYEFPKDVRNSNLNFPFLKNVINLPSYSIFSFFNVISVFILISLIILFHQYLERKKILFQRKISKPNRLLLLVAILITILIAFLTFRVNEEYTNHYPYYLDPVANNLRFVKIYEQLKDHSRFEVLLDQINTNTINPFRSIPLILAAPYALITKWGHSLNTLIFLFVFLYLMGEFVYKRTENIFFSISVLLFFVSAPVVFDGHDGLFPFYQDFSAGLILGSATLCFLFWHNTKQLKWIVYFSILVSFCILSRYNTFFYSIMLFSPVFLYSFYCHWKIEKNIWKTIIRPMIIVFVIVGIFCGYWLIKHFNYNFNYYSHSDIFGNTGLSIKSCIIGLFGRILIYFEEIYLFVISIMLALVLLFLRKNLKKDKENVYVLFWFIIIIPFYWIFILGLDAMKLGIAELVAYPIIFCSFVSIISISSKIKANYLHYLSIVILGWSCFLINDSFNKKFSEAKVPLSKAISDDKKLQLLFSDQIKKISNSSQQSKFVFQNFINRPLFNCNLALESYYSVGILPDYDHFLFSAEKSFGQKKYSIKEQNRLGDSIYNLASDELNLMLVFDDTSSVEISGSFKDEFSKFVARTVANKIKTDTAWKKTANINTIKYSTVSFYYKPK